VVDVRHDGQVAKAAEVHRGNPNGTGAPGCDENPMRRVRSLGSIPSQIY
jgi:hypothetical protein